MSTRWHCEEIEGPFSTTGRHAALCNAVPYQAKLPLDLCSTLSSAYKHRRSKLPITLRDQAEAPHHAPNDCSAHARSHSLYDRTTAVSPRYAKPFHLCTCLQQRRSSSNTHSACRSLDSDLDILYHTYMYRLRSAREGRGRGRSDERSTAGLRSCRAARWLISMACKLSR